MDATLVWVFEMALKIDGNKWQKETLLIVFLNAHPTDDSSHCKPSHGWELTLRATSTEDAPVLRRCPVLGRYPRVDRVVLRRYIFSFPSSVLFTTRSRSHGFLLKAAVPSGCCPLSESELIRSPYIAGASPYERGVVMTLPLRPFFTHDLLNQNGARQCHGCAGRYHFRL